MKTHWIAFLLVGLFHTTSAYAEKTYVDYLSEVKKDLAESKAALSDEVQDLGSRYTDIADDEDFEELKAKSVLLWVVRECHALAGLYTQEPDTLTISTSVSALSDFKEVAKERANEAAMRALNFSVEAARTEFRRQNLTAELFLERVKAPAEGGSFVEVLNARKSLESEIEILLHQELNLHEAIPMAYIEAALHAAVSALIRRDLGETEAAEQSAAAFELLLDSAATAYGDALVFFGSTRMDAEEFSRGLDAIDGAARIHERALASAARFL